MSLTKFISIPDVKQKFAEEFPLPSVSLKGPIIAPPITNNYGLVGTAFDYLMRFYLERLNPNCIKEPWVARISVELSRPSTQLFTATSRLLVFAEKSYQCYLKTGTVDDDILKSAIFLAQLDVIYRVGMVDKKMGTADEGDLSDLRNLLEAVKPDSFKAHEICILNPTFGDASGLVGGADADLLIDGVLIDIKTTKKLEFTREQYNQLVGYYILNRISGQMATKRGVGISTMGIYYSRYGSLHLIPTDVIADKENLSEFIAWFTNRARVEYPADLSRGH
jgi:hypothetical protein